MLLWVAILSLAFVVLYYASRAIKPRAPTERVHSRRRRRLRLQPEPPPSAPPPGPEAPSE